MTLASTVRFILDHPLNQDGRAAALARFASWQLRSRISSRPKVVGFVNGTQLLMRRGMTAATGNYYCGLHEFEDMSFVLHFLRPDDLFCDIGANIGAYSVIASGAIGARTLAFEPVPSTYQSLVDNIELNGLAGQARCLNMGVGHQGGTLEFTTGLGSTNHVSTIDDLGCETTKVEVVCLDDVVAEEPPSLIKIDVEGFESNVLMGGYDTLSNDRLQAVIMELNGSGKRYGFDDDALHHTMLDLGFQDCRYEPFERRLEPRASRAVRGNSLYVRDFETVSKRLAEAPAYRVNGMPV